MGPVRVLELRSVRGTGGGPEKTILLGAAGTDVARAAITVCYMRAVRDDVFHIGERAAALGIDYVEVLERHSFDRGVWNPLIDIVRQKEIAIIHSHDYKTDLLSWMIARKTGAVPLATAHGWTGHSWRERAIYYPAHKRLLARFPLVLAVSTEIRQELVSRGARPDRVQVLLNGIDHRAFRRDPSRVETARAHFGVLREDIVVGAVGRLEPQKRFDLLIEAVAKSHKAGGRLTLLIAGDGSSREALERRAAALPASRRVRLLGHVGDVALFHHALDLFVQSSDYEGTPNAVLEAMALETPVIATDVGGTAEICRPGVDGLIVPPGQVDTLSSAIVQTLHAPSAARERVRAARRRVEHELSFERRLRTLEGSYERLAGRVACAAS